MGGAYFLSFQNEKITSHGVSFYNLFAAIRSVDQKNCLTSLSNRILGSISYQTICGVIPYDVNQRQKKSTFLDRGQYMLRNGQL